MRIGVNARFLAKPFTGIGQHTRHLFTALAKQNPAVEFLMVVNEKIEEIFPKNMKVSVLPEIFPGSEGMKKTFWEQWQVPHFLTNQNVDVMHFPYPANPWFSSSKPVCVTVHDTIPWTMEAYRRALLTRLYQDRCLKALKKADHIFTVSQASLDDIVKLCPEVNDRLSITFNAPGVNFSSNLTDEQKQAVLEYYGLHKNRPYFLYVGGYDERKNVRTLVKVFKEQVAPYFDVDLALAGGKILEGSLYESFDETHGFEHEKKKDAHKKLKGNIFHTGFVQGQDLPVLYKSAFGFINISTKEGCNLPLLEAALSGVPVITSDLPVHREFVGDVALFCDPFDEKRLGEQMKRLIQDDLFYSQMREKVGSYYCPYSWEKAAEEVMGVYRKLIKKL